MSDDVFSMTYALHPLQISAMERVLRYRRFLTSVPVTHEVYPILVRPSWTKLTPAIGDI
jgi:hypothetical protein